MWMLLNLYIFLFVGGVLGWGKVLQITQEKITVDYCNNEYVDVTAGIYKLNSTTNALNGTITFKFDIKNNLKYYGAIFRKVNKDYSLNVMHMENTVREFTTTDAFGISDLCLKYTKPPAVWPLKKGVTYHSEGWSPDVSKFPPNLPEGKWKVKARLFFINKTKIIDASYYTEISYH